MKDGKNLRVRMRNYLRNHNSLNIFQKNFIFKHCTPSSEFRIKLPITSKQMIVSAYDWLYSTQNPKLHEEQLPYPENFYRKIWFSEISPRCPLIRYLRSEAHVEIICTFSDSFYTYYFYSLHILFNKKKIPEFHNTFQNKNNIKGVTKRQHSQY